MTLCSGGLGEERFRRHRPSVPAHWAVAFRSGTVRSSWPWLGLWLWLQERWRRRGPGVEHGPFGLSTGAVTTVCPRTGLPVSNRRATAISGSALGMAWSDLTESALQ